MNHILKYSIATAILVLGLFLQGCSSSKTVEVADLSGYWTLKSLKGEAASEAFKGSIPNLEFNLDNNQVSGSGGCNRYSGGFTLVGNIFKAPKLASTMKLCMEANKEDLYTATLSAEEGLTISIEKGILTFKDGDKVVLEFNKGQTPNAVAKAVTSENLLGTWTLTKMKEADASTLFGENPATLTYTDGGAVSGNAGCNNYRTNATLEENIITFGPIMSTKMACPHLEGEQIYTTILSESVEASIQGEQLFFKQNGEIVLTFLKDIQ